MFQRPQEAGALQVEKPCNPCPPFLLMRVRHKDRNQNRTKPNRIMKLTSIRVVLSGAFLGFTLTAFAAKPSPPPPPPQLENWQTVDDFVNGVTEALTVAPSGIIFAAGYGDTGQSYVGLIRASIDGGNTWSTTSTFGYPGLDTTFYSAIASDAAGHLYVSGLAHGDWITYTNDGGPAHWIVQRSDDGGVTWAMVDDFVPGGD